MKYWNPDDWGYIIAKWLGLAFLNSIVPFFFAISMVFPNLFMPQLISIIAAMLVVACIGLLFAYLEWHWQKQGCCAVLIQILTLGAILRMLLQMTLIVDMMIGALAISFVEYFVGNAPYETVWMWGVVSALATLFHGLLAVLLAIFLGAVGVGMVHLFKMLMQNSKGENGV